MYIYTYTCICYGSYSWLTCTMHTTAHTMSKLCSSDRRFDCGKQERKHFTLHIHVHAYTCTCIYMYFTVCHHPVPTCTSMGTGTYQYGNGSTGTGTYQYGNGSMGTGTYQYGNGLLDGKATEGLFIAHHQQLPNLNAGL